MFRLFPKYGWDINEKASAGLSALGIVLRDKVLTSWILAYKAKPAYAMTAFGHHILDVGAAQGSLAMMKLLVEHRAKCEENEALGGAGTKAKDFEEKAQYLTTYGRMEISVVQRRSTYGVAKSQDVGRDTPLHVAVLVEGRIRTLLSLGDDLRVENSRGQTPLELAIALKLPKVEGALKRGPVSSSST